MDDAAPMTVEEHEWAHDTGRLESGTWLCGCATCREVCRLRPEVLLVVKGSHDRRFVNAGQLTDGDAGEFLSSGFVEEVFVAQVQPSPKGGPRPPSPILRRLPGAAGGEPTAGLGLAGPQR
ncbi:MAG: hypothetical protein ACRDJU_13795 [Actinomycetota bacterium]